MAVAASGGLVWGLGSEPTAPKPSDQRIEVVDGPKDDQHVTIDATFYPSATKGRSPAVLLAHGFGGDKDDSRTAARELAADGYAVLTWSARGFGKSTGEIALDSPDYEVKDTRQLIDWLAKRPDVLLDKAGDPRVGMTGPSYGGAISLLTAAYDQRVDAIVPKITWNDLSDSLLPNGVFKKLWAGLFFTRESNGSSPCGRFLPSICAMYQEIAETGKSNPEAVQLLKRSSPATAPRIKAPALLIQGQSDSLFPLDQADRNSRLVDGPVSVVWYQGGHDGGAPETTRLADLTAGWFDRYLKKGTAETPKFEVTRTAGIDYSDGRLAIPAAIGPIYPGLSNAPRKLALTGNEQTVQNPAGGVPASISAVPGFGALSSLSSLGLGGGASLDMPGQSATFETAPLSDPLRVTGAPSLRIRTDKKAVLFAKLYDVGPNGATPARRLAAPITVDGDADVVLPALDYEFARGHRLRVVLSTTDMGFSGPLKPDTYKISKLSDLSVPTNTALQTRPPGPPAWVWILPLVAAAIAAALLFRRRTKNSHDVRLDGVPLEITGLTKAYKNGYLAVDDLSFRVEQGQVLGLLGPNGAGKTTTLRMLMGLIHPDSGEIRIFGHRVTPGAPVLNRLGSFVEGPGFLPHLTGRDNINLYWRATGRPLADAHIDEALKIADLGEALDRPVRTYSQGMRQRLAIAQAMLGLPDLLVLDEPTNGLDPPQIREMRSVLVRYAETGRTVIVSSHLLSEVEQTCTNVVVMTRGRKVADGPVSEIVGGRGLEDVFLEIIGGHA
jgi:ABC-2 type transport system ATP-binding protein